MKGGLNRIYVRMSEEKKFLKKLEMKMLCKKVLGRNVTANKVLSFRFLGLLS